MAFAFAARALGEPAPVVLYANDFNAGGASLEGWKPFIDGGRDGVATIAVAQAQLRLTVGDVAKAGVGRDLRIGRSIFREHLPENPGLLTWSFNLSNTDGLFNNRYYVILASSHGDIDSGFGYVLEGGGFVGSRMMLRRFGYGAGIPDAVIIDVVDGLGTLPAKGSFRITYDPETSIWSLYGTVGTSYVDPAEVGTLLGSGKSAPAPGEATPFFGLATRITGTAFFDNVRVTLARDSNHLPVLRTDEVTFTGAPSLMIYPLANDDDPEGGPLHITSVSTPAFGTIEIIPGTDDEPDALRYTPGTGAMENGETLTYTVSDTEGGVASGQILIAPVTNSGGPELNLFLRPGEAPTISLAEGLPGTGPWRILEIVPPRRGSLVVVSGVDPSLVQYSPPQGKNRNDNFAVSLINPGGIVMKRDVRVQAPLAGSFEGLYIHSQSPRAIEGRLRAKLSRSRHFTAVAELRGKTVRFKGQFSPTGVFRSGDDIDLRIRRNGQGFAVRSFSAGELDGQYPAEEVFTIDPLPPQPEGAVSKANGWYADARRMATGSPGNLAGSYTFMLPSPDATTSEPDGASARGHGWGLLRVSKNGAVTLSGATGDNARWTGGAWLRRDRTLLLYASLAKRKDKLPGALAGLLLFRQSAKNSDGDGVLNWLPSFSPSQTERLSGIAQRQPFLLSRYVKPASGALPLPTVPTAGNALFTLRATATGPAWAQTAFTARSSQNTPVTLKADSFASASKSRGLRVSGNIRRENGLIKGSVSDGRRKTPFSGVLFQKRKKGFGSLKADGLQGPVSLSLTEVHPFNEWIPR